MVRRRWPGSESEGRTVKSPKTSAAFPVRPSILAKAGGPEAGFLRSRMTRRFVEGSTAMLRWPRPSSLAAASELSGSPNKITLRLRKLANGADRSGRI